MSYIRDGNPMNVIGSQATLHPGRGIGRAVAVTVPGRFRSVGQGCKRRARLPGSGRGRRHGDAASFDEPVIDWESLPKKVE
jgi:hypothetical protein